MYRVELSKRALRDLRRLDRLVRQRLLDLLERELAAEPQPPNLDVKALVGRSSWLRLRRGEHRITYRPLTEPELARLRLRSRLASSSSGSSTAATSSAPLPRSRS
jgi:mRNA-degrading endonuclease RelE of RelBE toxin-antitoxin system